MLEFIINYWEFILLAILITAALIYIIFRGEKSVALKMLYSMVTEAEKEYGGGTGVLKLAAVVEKLYPMLPVLVRTFVSANTLQKWIEIVLAEAKETWEKNANISTYIKS